MKASFEKLLVPARASSLQGAHCWPAIPFEWHYHPEYELTLTMNSTGQRFVGDHVGEYNDHDLVLIGPEVPHTWESSALLRQERSHEILITWFRPGWIEALVPLMPELSAVERMCRRASRGLAWSPEAGRRLEPDFRRLQQLDGAERVSLVLSILGRLARLQCQELSSPGAGSHVRSGPDQDRIEAILDCLHAQYRRQIRLDELAALVHLSVSALSRLFVRCMRMSITDYVARLRIGHACGLLVRGSAAISFIAQEVGYHNLAHFNRQFRAQKSMTPREYRRLHSRR